MINFRFFMFFGASEASADCFQSRKHTQNSPSFRRGGKIFEENFDGVVLIVKELLNVKNSPDGAVCLSSYEKRWVL